jgi:hypothetical protein
VSGLARSGQARRCAGSANSEPPLVFKPGPRDLDMFKAEGVAFVFAPGVHLADGGARVGRCPWVLVGGQQPPALGDSMRAE